MPRPILDSTRNIANYLGDRCNEHVVSVILDGENARVLPGQRLPFHRRVVRDTGQQRISTRSPFTEGARLLPAAEAAGTLPLAAGCTAPFSTWIGEEDKNRAWDMLVEAKKVYDRVMGPGASPRKTG